MQETPPGSRAGLEVRYFLVFAFAAVASGFYASGESTSAVGFVVIWIGVLIGLGMCGWLVGSLFRERPRGFENGFLLTVVAVSLILVGSVAEESTESNSGGLHWGGVAQEDPTEQAEATQPVAGIRNITMTAWGSDAQQTLDLYVSTLDGEYHVELPPNSEIEHRLTVSCHEGETFFDFSIYNVLGELVGENLEWVDCGGHDCHWVWVQEDGGRNQWGEPTFQAEIWDDLTAPKGSCA